MTQEMSSRRGWRALGPTNIRLRWSREGIETVLQTFGSAGAGKGSRVLQTFGSAGAGKASRRSYKHSAPLEPGRGRALWVLQTFGPLEPGGGRESYKHSAPLEPGRGRGLWMLLFDVRVFREAGSSVVPHATRKLVHSAIRH